MTSRIFKTLGLSVGMMACASPAIAQSDVDVQQRLDALQAEVERLRQRLNDQESAQQASTQPAATQQETADQQAVSSKTREMVEENRSMLDELDAPRFTGGLEYGYVFNDWNESDKDKAGDIDFGKFILGMEGGEGPLTYSFQYRFYDGYRFLQHGWAGYRFGDNDQVKLGLVQLPFGNMDYGYLGWYGTLAYLGGFNDNQNVGLKWDHTQGAWDTSLAFFKSDQLGEGNEHYGANAVGNSAQGNSEENQLAGRVAYTFNAGSDYTTELNASAKGGQLYNENTHESGDNWQVALGLNGNYGNWQTLLQATHYEYNAENPNESASGISDDVIQIGAFGFNYLIPAEAEVYTASLGYSMDVEWGALENLYFFNDFSYIDPREDYSAVNGGFGDMDDPMLNDLGVKVTAGRYYAWFDVITNKNGLNYFGSPVDDGWHTSFQSNFGLTF